MQRIEGIREGNCVSRLLALYQSSLGKKAIVAVTGAILLGFLVLHVVGNLKAFLPDPQPGVPDIDVYARFLRTAGEPLLPYAGALWMVRIVLLGAISLHILCVVQLAWQSRRSRPVAYARTTHVQATASARWMLYTGSFLAFFIVVHLLQFTTGSIDSARFVEGAVYANLHRTFQLWYYAAFYAAAMVVLGLHLYHGAWSLFQSLGLDNPDRNRGLRGFAVLAAVGLFLAFVSVPAAFFLGGMKPPPDRTLASAPASGVSR
jgi:succinate dehydrogenase / fumarate reductase cytochrome b subunit